MADVQGFQLPNGGTAPPEVLVAAKQLGIEIELFELASCMLKLDNNRGSMIDTKSSTAQLVAL